jgi:gamma-glutamyltranspeptidase/glutathione hydrolase
MAAIDRNGLAVSFIQSVFWAFGAGLVLPGTGIVWQNRGSAFSLEPGHPNALEPGIRPFHTLNPALARLADGRVMVYGTMGGDAQALIQAQVFTRHVMHGVDLADALDRPRFVLDRADADATIVKVESRFDADILYALERAGHRIEVLDAAYADMMGHAGAIVRRPDGTMTGAADPRSDGAARAG